MVNDNIDQVRESIDRERTNLLTVIAALSFLVVCLLISNISVLAFSATAVNEREAVSIALDDQRLQYYQCVEYENSIADCEGRPVSPSSRDIKRDLEGSGFSSILYAEREVRDETIEESRPNREAFGVLGYIVYGE